MIRAKNHFQITLEIPYENRVEHKRGDGTREVVGGQVGSHKSAPKGQVLHVECGHRSDDIGRHVPDADKGQRLGDLSGAFRLHVGNTSSLVIGGDDTLQSISDHQPNVDQRGWTAADDVEIPWIV